MNQKELEILLEKEIKSRKKAEKLLAQKSLQLNELNKQLENRIAEEIEKNGSQEKLLVRQSKMASMGEMLGIISHQWRQPLNSVGMMVQEIFFTLKLNKIEHSVNPSLKDDIMRQLDYMAHTIDDFKNFLKENKKKEDTNLLKEMGFILQIVSASLVSTNIKISFYVDGKHQSGLNEGYFIDDFSANDRYNIVTYPNEFKQVIINIINNSKDAISSTLLMDEERVININIDDKDTTIEISIEDNAGGIKDKDKLEKIWTSYFTTKEEGTGIGLFISKSIVENNLGGTINAVNGNYGLKTTIELPKNI